MVEGEIDVVTVNAVHDVLRELQSRTPAHAPWEWEAVAGFACGGSMSLGAAQRDEARGRRDPDHVA